MMLSELQSLAALASSLPDITVVVGKSNCPWSFNWATRIITANPEDLVLRAPDYARGLILHESAHGAITRYGQIVPENLMRSEPGLHHLLNVVEDCRIENWLQQRFPGSRPWIRLYNDRLLTAPEDPSARARITNDPAAGFLFGLLNEWWREDSPCELHPLSHAAIAEVKPHFQQAVEAFPDPLPPAAEIVFPLYASHPVAACYRASDRDGDPSAAECVIRMTQHRMWAITWAHIVPVFRRLLEHPDSQTMHCERVMRTIDHPMHTGIPNAGRGEGADKPPVVSEQAYDAAIAQHGCLIESCAEVLLRELIEASRPRTTRFHRSGNSLDLRVAMQFEADPRQYDRLFQRRTLPAHPNPAFMIVADESASMNGERAQATFDAVVVLREVCLRLDIPLAILGFGSKTRRIQDWNDENSPETRHMLSALLNPTGSNSHILQTLDAAMGLQMRLPDFYQSRLWILSDGEITNPNDVRRSITRFQMGGIPVHALGLGPDSHGLKKIIPEAHVCIRPKDLPRVFSELLRSQFRP